MYASEARLAGPTAPEWKNWLEARLLVAGAVLVLAALIYFFAWNWQRLPAAFRLFLVQGLFTLSVAGVLAARLRASRSAALAADLALTSACVLIGVFWAVFGQIYQTGADAWQLFALWSLCMLPWLAAGFSLPLWILWTAVSNLALFLWSVQELSLPGAPWSEPFLFPDLSMPLLFSFCAWSACALASLKTNLNRWYERSAAVFALLCATQSLCLFLLDISGYGLLAFAPLLALAATGLIFFRSLRGRDLFCLNLLGLCGYFLLNCLLVKLFKDSFFYEFTFTALIFVLANTGYTALLIKMLPHPRLPGSKAGPLRRGQGDDGAFPSPDHEQPGNTGSLGRTLLLNVGGVLSGFFLLVFFVALLLLGSQSELSILGGGVAALVAGAAISRSGLPSRFPWPGWSWPCSGS